MVGAMQVITTFEHALLSTQDFGHTADFDWLMGQGFSGFDVLRRQGQWFIKVGHYLGVICLPSGTLLEVLPKITASPDSDHDDHQAAAIAKTRAWVQTMLTTIWQGLTPRTLPQLTMLVPSDHAPPSLPVWLADVFWQLFALYQPNQQYRRDEQNQAYIQGKLLITEQLRHNAHQPYKFYTAREQLAPDTASNRLIKATYQLLSQLRLLPMAGLSPTWQAVAEVSPTGQVLEGLLRQSQYECHALTPIMRGPTTLLVNLCYALLSARQGLASVGHLPTPSVLMNMQVAFEQWVTRVASVQFDNVQPQCTQALVVTGADNLTPLLSIKPDLQMSYQGERIVADIKWKAIGQVRDIRLADMYQLMVYASETHAGQAWLIYPTHDAHRQAAPIQLLQATSSAFWLVPFLLNDGRLVAPVLD